MWKWKYFCLPNTFILVTWSLWKFWAAGHIVTRTDREVASPAIIFNLTFDINVCWPDYAWPREMWGSSPGGCSAPRRSQTGWTERRSSPAIISTSFSYFQPHITLFRSAGVKDHDFITSTFSLSFPCWGNLSSNIIRAQQLALCASKLWEELQTINWRRFHNHP